MLRDTIARIALNVKNLRERANLTQAQLSVKSGVYLNGISRIERADGVPTLNSLAAIAETLDIKVLDLIYKSHPASGPGGKQQLLVTTKKRKPQSPSAAASSSK